MMHRSACLTLFAATMQVKLETNAGGRPGDGRMPDHYHLAGKDARLSGTTLSLSSGAELPLEQLESFVTGVEPAAHTVPPLAILAFDDGTRLVGSLKSVTDGTASAQITASSSVVTAPTSGLQRIRLHIPAPADAAMEPPFAKQDKVVVGKVTLHGQVLGSGGPEPRWLPVGGGARIRCSVQWKTGRILSPVVSIRRKQSSMIIAAL